MAEILKSLMEFIRNLVKKVASISIEDNEQDSTPANFGKRWFRR